MKDKEKIYLIKTIQISLLLTIIFMSFCVNDKNQGMEENQSKLGEISVPIYPKAQNVYEYKTNDEKSRKSFFYNVESTYPSTAVLDFYDQEFMKSGFETIEPDSYIGLHRE